MKILSTEMGRVIQFFFPEEIRPTKGIYVPELVRLVGERYGFAVLPIVAEMIKPGATANFRQGRLVSADRTINILELGIHNDAIAVTTDLNTNDADFVLQDVWAWAKHALGLREPTTQRLKLYESHFVVEFGSSIDDALTIFENVRAELHGALRNVYNQELPVNFNRITFSVDPIIQVEAQLQLVRTELWIERKTGTPYTQNRYFSACGLPTNIHAQLLERFEAATRKSPQR